MDKLVVSGAREHNLKDVTVAIPRDVADRDHRPVGIGQVVAGLRHDLCRGAAAVRRVAVGLRAAVPRADGQARRRLDRGALAGDLDRSEDDLAQPALDRRDGDRDLRLPAAAVGADRPPALPHLRPPDQRPVGRADHRPGHGAARRDAVHGAGADRARAQGRVRQAARGAARRGLHPRQGRRRAAPARRGDRARQEVQARHRGRGRPPGHEGRAAQAAGRLDRDRGRAGRRAGRDRAGRHRRDPDLLGEVRLPGARPEPGRARAAHLQLQLPARGVPALHRAGIADGDRPRAGRARPDAVDRRGRDRAVGGQRLRLLRPADPGHRGALRGRPRHALGGAARARRRNSSCTGPTATVCR